MSARYMKSILLIPLLTATGLFGQKHVLELNPAQTRVEFTLSDVLHTVHGSFRYCVHDAGHNHSLRIHESPEKHHQRHGSIFGLRIQITRQH